MISLAYTIKRILFNYEMKKRIRENTFKFVLNQFTESTILLKNTNNMIAKGVMPDSSVVRTHVWSRLDGRIFRIRYMFNMMVFDYMNWERKVDKKQLLAAYDKL